MNLIMQINDVIMQMNLIMLHIKIKQEIYYIIMLENVYYELRKNIQKVAEINANNLLHIPFLSDFVVAEYKF